MRYIFFFKNILIRELVGIIDRILYVNIYKFGGWKVEEILY